MNRKTTLLLVMLFTGLVIAGGLVSSKQLVSSIAQARPGGASVRDSSAAAGGWHSVDSLLALGLTESALKEVDELYQKAKRQNSPTEQVKALLYRMRLESYKEEQSTAKAINELESDAAQATGPLGAVIHSITAEVYWRYYEQNRRRFYNRSQTISFQQDDIATWDLSKIVAATLSHYDASLGDENALRKIPPTHLRRHLARYGKMRQPPAHALRLPGAPGG